MALKNKKQAKVTIISEVELASPPSDKEPPITNVILPLELPQAELPRPPPKVIPDFIYNKELTFEQLQQIFALSVNLEDAARYLAGIMQLGDCVFDARNLILLEYCLGNLMFAKHAGMNMKQSHVIYDLGHLILDIIRESKPFGDAENIFRNRLLSLSLKDVEKIGDPIFSQFDLQKITPYFTSTVFQHYCLYQYCFTKVHYNITKDEKVWIETTMISPLSEALSQEEVDARAAAQVAAEAKFEVDNAHSTLASFEAITTEVALRAEEEIKRKPLNLQDAIELAVKDKINDAKKSLIEEYEYWEKVLIEKILKMHEEEVRASNQVVTNSPQKISSMEKIEEEEKEIVEKPSKLKKKGKF